MNIIPTELEGVLIIEPRLFGDQRGFFTELYEAGRYADAGTARSFVQDNLSRSTRGVLRGLHVQCPNPQGKLLTVLRGGILDVAVDVRVGSPTFGHHIKIELNEENRRQFWIPRGFAHGFLVLSEVAEVFYKCDARYSPADELVLKWDDPTLAIDWGCSQPTISERDRNGRTLKELAGSLPSVGAMSLNTVEPVGMRSRRS